MSKNQNEWFAVEITIDSEASEAIEFALNELDALGTEINNLGKKQTENLCVIGYFNERQNDKTVQTRLDEALRIYNLDQTAIKNFSWREVENKDWLAEWKKHWRPTKVGNFIIAPTWSEVGTDENSQNRETIIRIDPEMAFGTGTHETTRLCLQVIEENYADEMSFLDVGTGTGILAIAAAKIKSKVQSLKSKVRDSLTHHASLTTHHYFWACDTDENSIEIARKNAVLNNVDEDIYFYVGSINADTPIFDFICANLTADVIVPILPLLLKKTKSEIVLSGILREQQELIENELKRLQVLNWSIRTLGEWISIKVGVRDLNIKV